MCVHFSLYQAPESGLPWSQEFATIFGVLSNLLGDQQSLSAYEVYSSNIIPSLLQCLTGVGRLAHPWGGRGGGECHLRFYLLRVKPCLVCLCGVHVGGREVVRV